MRRNPKLLLALFVALVPTACEFNLLAPDNPSLDGLDIRLTVSPAEVAPGGELEGVLTIRNPYSRTVVLRAGHGCLAFVGVYRDGERLGFTGTNYACTAVVTNFEIEPGETLERRWSVTAYDEDLEEPAAVGGYRFRVEFTVRGLADEERPFAVR